jgi:hypothetical protein
MRRSLLPKPEGNKITGGGPRPGAVLGRDIPANRFQPQEDGLNGRLPAT